MEPFRELVPAELDLLEDLRIGPEGHCGAVLLGGLALGELGGRFASSVGLAPGDAVALNLDDQLLRKSVHDRNADAVKAAGDPVALAPELAAGVQGRQDDLDGRTPVLRLRDGFHGDASTVVGDSAAAVLQQRDDDLVAEARHSLVDRVVDHLVDEVVETSEAGGADVHPGAEPNVLDAFEYLDVRRLVLRRLLRCGCQSTSVRPGHAGGHFR